MLRRLFVPALVVMASGCLLSVPLRSLAQEVPTPSAAGQESPAPEATAPAVTAPQEAAKTTAPDPQQAKVEFDAKHLEWKELLKGLRKLKSDYQVADEPTRAAMEGQWKEAVAKANEYLSTVVAAAANAYRAAPNEDRQCTSFLVKVLDDDVEHDRYAAAVSLADVLIEGQCDMPQIYRAAAIANFSLNNLDKALSLAEKAEATGARSSSSTDKRELRKKDVEQYIEYWKQEQACREKEAAADDLPRVKLTTSKGDIVLELFENEAPETVGNFVSLVAKRFYDGLTFHRVISGFMAQGGCPEGDGSGGPGYAIYDESAKPEARKHFRGSLSMAKTAAPNSGGSQFFITFWPAANLNGLHTVFGRVTEGMDVVDRITRREADEENGAEPDTIVKAEVLRKRDHEYLPHKVE